MPDIARQKLGTIKLKSLSEMLHGICRAASYALPLRELVEGRTTLLRTELGQVFGAAVAPLHLNSGSDAAWGDLAVLCNLTAKASNRLNPKTHLKFTFDIGHHDVTVTCEYRVPGDGGSLKWAYDHLSHETTLSPELLPGSGNAFLNRVWFGEPGADI
jgi:hypothetical protein